MPAPAEIQASLRSQNAPESHLVRLGALLDAAIQSKDVLAYFLVGSYAKGLGDRVSDLDLVGIARPNRAAAVLAAARSLLEDQEVFNQFIGEHPNRGVFTKIVYLNLSSIELHFFDHSSGFKLRRPYLSLWDPTRIATTLLAEGPPIRHEDFSAYEFGDAGLTWELVDCIKWLSRGNSSLAKHHLLKIAKKLDDPK